MYVFAPGAGCTGPMRLVRLGDEMIFNSTYNPQDWITESKPKLEYEESSLPSTCPGGVATSTHEFKPPLTEEGLVKLSHKNFSPETMKQIRWVRKMYCEWHDHRHSQGLDYIQCDLEDKATITAKTLKFALCRFITEIKKVNGEDFPGKTLYLIVVCVQFHLECLGFAFKLINDPAFKDLKYTLDSTMKARCAQEIGHSVCKAECIDPDQLLNTVIFCIGKGFALWAGQEHRALRGFTFQSQFKFMHDPDREIFLRYMEDLGLKTNKGSLHHRKIEAKVVDLYATSNPDRCPMHVIMKYLSLLPKGHTCPAFYLQPRKKFFGKVWYVNRLAGVNHLWNAVRDMCHDVGLPGHYSNHSLRATAITKLYQNDIDEQVIMKITGHRPLAVHSYKRTSDKQRKLASRCLFERP